MTGPGTGGAGAGAGPTPDERAAERAAALAALRRLALMAPDDPERETLREHVIGEYMPYARHLAGKYGVHGNNSEDVLQVAYLGLVKAVDNYDPEFGTTFLTYATPMIIGEIKRHFRDSTWAVHVPRRVQELTTGLRAATEKLTQDLNRSPTVEELAAEMNCLPEEVVDALDAVDAHNTASLEVPVDTDDGRGTALGDLIGDEDPGIDQVIDREAVKPLLALLGPREKRILLMRYFHNMTQRQIGEELGVSQMQVSRLLSQILGKLREKLGA